MSVVRIHPFPPNLTKKMDDISKESLFKAFELYDNCGMHSSAECKVLNNLFHIALQIEQGDSPQDAYDKMRVQSPLEIDPEN
jgi:hypothetical protein